MSHRSRAEGLADSQQNESHGAEPGFPSVGSPPFLGLDPHGCGLSAGLSEDIVLVDRLLGAVLADQEDAQLLSIARRLYAERDGEDPSTLMERIPELKDAGFVQRLLRAYTILFQLLNTAEQKEIVRVNRERQAHAGGAPRSESISEAIRTLARVGTTVEEMQELIDRLDICPTLTAHPTEARRRSVLDKLQAIAHALVERAVPASVPRLDGPLNTAEWTEQEMARALTALWQTDEVRASALTVTDEAANTLYFFEHSIFDVVSWLHDDLRAALKAAYPGRTFEIGPFVRYSSWVGGDRDGNPNVTADVTWETLVRHKARILEHYIGKVAALRRELTQSARIAAPSDELVKSLEAERERATLTLREIRRYRREPYALKLVYMEARLRASLAHLAALGEFRRLGAPLPAPPPAYQNANELVADLRLIQRSLRQGRGALFADEGPLAHLLSQALTFGFHLATLDIRQHSDEHGEAVAEMIAAARILPPEKTYASLGEEEKVRLLRRELKNPAPAPAARCGARGEGAKRARGVRNREARQTAPLSRHGSRLRDQHDARRERYPGSAPACERGGPRALAPRRRRRRARKRSRRRAALRNDRRPARMRCAHAPALRRQRVPRAFAGTRRLSGNHARLFGQQQGRRLPGRELDAL